MRGFMLNMPPMVKNLIIINVLMWLGSITLLNVFNFRIEEYLGLHYIGASDFRPHQLISYMFLHSYYRMSLGHIFFNMFALYMFGRILEQVWGAKRFLIYYMVTGIGAAVIQEAVWYFSFSSAINEFNGLMQNFPSGGVNVGDAVLKSRDQLMDYKDMFLNAHVTIGASGAVFGILLAFGMLFPNTEIMLLIPPIPIKAKIFVVIYGVLELFLGVASFSGDNVAHFAHLGGMLFGFFLIKYWQKHPTRFY